MSTVEHLANKECVPCQGGVPPLKGLALNSMHEKLGRDWNVVDEHHLEKEFHFRNFREALDFTNRVGEIAEQQNHHPDIFLTWGKVHLTIYTHKLNGLSENDFVLASKIQMLRKS